MRVRFFLVFLSLIHSFLGFAQIDSTKLEAFIQRFADNYQVDVRPMLRQAEYQESIIQKMEKPAEKAMEWHRYRGIFMTEKRINAGLEFWDQNAATLKEVSEQTGVAEEIIVGIIGVETHFGQNKGTYRVLDALYTLAFGYPKRSTFFTRELEEFLILAKEENLDVFSLKGSYAGAMGYCQFMPSSYRAYARSFDEGSNRDLMTPEDAIASVANYLKVHRWAPGALVARQASVLPGAEPIPTGSLKPSNTLAYYNNLGYRPSGNLSPSVTATLIELQQPDSTEYWFGFNNFYVITRYNHSALYAMAVYELATAIRAKRIDF